MSGGQPGEGGELGREGQDGRALPSWSSRGDMKCKTSSASGPWLGTHILRKDFSSCSHTPSCPASFQLHVDVV